MKNLVAFPLLAVILMFQLAIFSRITLFSGMVDLMLVVLVAWALQEQVESSWHWAAVGGLMVGAVSGLPILTYPLAYLLSVALARFILRQIWQTPLLALFGVMFFSTLIVNLVTYLALFFTGTTLSFGDILALITLPSVFLNLLLALPVHSLIRDLALWVYPVDDMV